MTVNEGQAALPDDDINKLEGVDDLTRGGKEKEIDELTMPEGAETIGTIPSTNLPSRQAKRYKSRTVGKDIGKKLREHDTLVE